MRTTAHLRPTSGRALLLRRAALGITLLGLSAACEPDDDMLPRLDGGADAFDGHLGDMPDTGDVSVPDEGVPGTEGQPCRGEDPPCDDPLRCVESTCTLPGPGERGQPCRPDEPQCDVGLICDGDEPACVPDPMCPDPCDLGETRCADSDEVDGYIVCGGRAQDDCTEFGTDADDPVIVECDPGRTCMGTTCMPADNVHRSPEFALLVDRGIDMALWSEWRDAIVGWVEAVQPAIAVGAQTFPAEGPCLLGPQAASSRNSPSEIDRILDLPPPPDLGRPLYAVMGRVFQLLGRPSEAQFAVLITTGDETCDAPERFVRRVRALRGRGIRTRIIRVIGPDTPREPRDDVLDAAGFAGGLAVAEQGGYLDVVSPSELRDALDALAERADPACVDLDEDGRGPFCDGGSDCLPFEATAYEGGIEGCDGIDNDCDGTVDEGLAAQAPAAALTEGPCAGLRQSCVDGAWAEPDYVAEVEGYEHSVEQSCDSVDNDCDGTVDEGLGDRTGPCTVGLGACEMPGEFVCDPAFPDVSVCDASPGAPIPEACDGVDNDCDGIIDEDAPQGGVELCNGRDDDCDDSIDETPDLAQCPAEQGQVGLACAEGACALACRADVRDADGQPGCEAPGYGALGLGDGFTCLIDPASGQPECYGRDDAPIPPAGDIAAIAAGGRHACVLFGGDRDGEIACAGPDPTLAAATAGRYTAIGIGDRIGCGINPAGTLDCWSADVASAGQFGIGRRAVHLAVGGRHACTLDAAGNAQCYGACGQGCLGQGLAPQRPTFAQLAAGAFHTCGLDDRGILYCWGAGRDPCVGALCGEQQGQSRPPAGAGYRAVAVGDLHSCAIDADYAIECWGLADDGRTNPPAGRFSAIWGGQSHTCARRFDGRVRCWGLDVGGETAPLD